MNIDTRRLSPMMKNYMQTKEEYPGCILFYRLGDFYEMFFDDALCASRELELTLTGKSCGLDERAPMCGVPYHAADNYINRLIKKGYKVAVCEQVEDPKQAKGLVRREVVRIVTPGTNMDPQGLDESKNNYLLCISAQDKYFGMAVADISTGEFIIDETDSEKKLRDEIFRFSPAEIIIDPALGEDDTVIEEIKGKLKIEPQTLDAEYFAQESAEEIFKDSFDASSLSEIGLDGYTPAVSAAGALLSYVKETQKQKLTHLSLPQLNMERGHMVIDDFSRRNLELTETIREKQRKGSLLWVLDKTKTAMGARMLRTRIEEPLMSKDKIERRLDTAEELLFRPMHREEIREYLGSVYDLERLLGLIISGKANPKDLIAFRTSISMLPHIKTLLCDFSSDPLLEISGKIESLTDLRDEIEAAIDEDAPAALREGGIIKEGYSDEADQLRMAQREGRRWLGEIEAKEREKSGIKNLRIKYNKVFGYYLEVTKSYRDMVPEYYIRKQTLVGAERYVTAELQEMEARILGAQERLYALEYELFSNLRSRIADRADAIRRTARAVAALDVSASMAVAAEKYGYTRPHFNDEGKIEIKDGRHPVIERLIENEIFVPNDGLLDNAKSRITIITGPNMAGKSTYMRQTALIVLMAQIGSFVPASSADLCMVDRIFTRVGASDDLSSGQSTFMVEMCEVANILREATPDSLLILDEIGRGTGTIDGLSIARAVIEYIHGTERAGAKTLFATHFNELTELEGKLDGVCNASFTVRERGDEIIFLRKIIPGGTDKSYGIHVARLAGVPEPVIERAKEIFRELQGERTCRA